jgi:hypothetical protein
MKTIVLILGLVLALSMVAGLALAAGAERPREVLSGGASEASAGALRLRATLGEPMVGLVSASGPGGDVTLGQGFWHGGVVTEKIRVYLPLVKRDS